MTPRWLFYPSCTMTVLFEGLLMLVEGEIVTRPICAARSACMLCLASKCLLLASCWRYIAE
jgi:hypothetical protein